MHLAIEDNGRTKRSDFRETQAPCSFLRSPASCPDREARSLAEDAKHAEVRLEWHHSDGPYDGTALFLRWPNGTLAAVSQVRP
jgi:hypothetical protein